MKNPGQKAFLVRTTIQFAAVLITAVIFASCTTKDHKQTGPDVEAIIPDSVYVKAGNQLVAKTFDTLRSSLLTAIKAKGFADAISFCNENAYPITDIYADSVKIRRTSLRYRNSNNQPDSLELSVLTVMEEEMKSIKKTDTRLVRNSATGEIHFFKPIMLQPLCLNCHGTADKQIQPETLARIQELYPTDQAVNFHEGDLRGVWHIIFAKK
ncbi:DUF3365 domain-containing protein [Chryseolinea sp. H1M3-3]|uniref:Tll0287-like domain-containing protein n=1 Tax=Chryseolinea sp. H1M3-3 TaxID=3034144 RepID=UPI0023ECB456|nr:DUF3365 domain-containing protein [Chryseolinea sp. H1M3-3]